MRSRAKRVLLGQKGIALLEVLIATVILGIATVGVTLLLSHAQTAVIGQGDRYVALYLAQQRIESLTAPLLQNSQTGFAGLPMGTSTEVLQAGEAFASGLPAAQNFTRTTCINFAQDTDPTNPAACPCVGGGCPNNTNTKRITVTVTLSSPTGTTNASLGADPATLVTVVTRHPLCTPSDPC